MRIHVSTCVLTLALVLHGPVSSQELGPHDKDYDLLHVEVDLTVDPGLGSCVKGSVQNRVRANAGGCSLLRFHAAPTVTVDMDRAWDAQGNELPCERIGSFFVVTLAEPLEAFEEEWIRMEYTAQCPAAGGLVRPQGIRRSSGGPGTKTEVWTLGQFQGTRTWIPTWDYPNDVATFGATLRIPSNLAALSTGRLLTTEDDGLWQTTTWRADDPLPTYLFSLAVGPWVMVEDAAGSLPIRYVRPAPEPWPTLEPVLRKAPAMLSHFERILGSSYGYPRLDLVLVHELSVDGSAPGRPVLGMENPTMVLLRLEAFDGTDGLTVDTQERILAHELAHHWFGNRVTNESWRHLWLHEAWATHLELHWLREMNQDAHDLALESLRDASVARDSPALLLSPDVSSFGADFRHVYDKGAAVLHMLEHELGARPFWASARLLLQDRRHRQATTADLVRAIREATGRDVEPFFLEWVAGSGQPTMTASVVDDAGTTFLEIDESIGTPSSPGYGEQVAVETVFVDGSRGEQRFDVYGAAHREPLGDTNQIRDVLVHPGPLLMRLELTKPASMWAAQLADGRPLVQWRAVRSAVAQEQTVPALKAALDALLASTPHESLAAHVERLRNPQN